jgi:F-type H+-transporting ATPase subunit delta
MAEDYRQSVAKVYAEALFSLASECGQNETVLEEINTLADLIEKENDFAVFLASRAISPERKIAVFEKVFGAIFSELMMNFLGVVVKKERVSLLTLIRRSYVDLEDQRAGRVKGTLTTAVALEDGERVRLSEQISRALRKTFSLKTKVDAGILGGMILTVGDRVIDGSIRGSLERMARRFQKNVTLPAVTSILEE